MKKTKELLPCPFCGSDAIISDEGENYYYVGCGNTADECDVMPCLADEDVDDMVKKWNKRVDLNYRVKKIKETYLEGLYTADDLRKEIRELGSEMLVADMGFSIRTANSLMAERIMTIDDLTKCTKDKLLRKCGVGRKAFFEIIDVLATYDKRLME